MASQTISRKPNPIQPFTAEQKRNIDLGLTVLCAVAKYDETLSQGEIAEICGCSRGMIGKIEKRAMQKIKEQFFQMGISDSESFNNQ